MATLKHLSVNYGESSEQFFRLTHADSDDHKPVLVIIHGGFWKQAYGWNSALIDSVAPFYANRGYVVCEVEYRRGNASIDGGAGGWPKTNEDILSALCKLHSFSESGDNKVKMDMKSVVILGHSAGGTLCLYPCCDGIFQSLPFKPLVCVSVAPIGDLLEGARVGLSEDGKAVQNYMGGELADLESEYIKASPSQHLPIQCKLLLICGTNDFVVPQLLIEKFYQQALKACQDHNTRARETTEQLNALVHEPTFVTYTGANHFQLVDATSEYWDKIVNEIDKAIAEARSVQV